MMPFHSYFYIDQMWNWQAKHWPNFQWDKSKIDGAEALFLESVGVAAGASKHINLYDQQLLSIELISSEALDTSQIEGEYLNRDSVQSSVRQEFGLKTDLHRASPAEAGVAEMMVNLYKSLSAPLSESMLFGWHKLLMNGCRDVENVAAYRTHSELMQIVSGPDYNRKIHFEAPPSLQVQKEMALFLGWFDNTSPAGKTPLPAVTRAAISHIWFESIHPFEDDNGRIGRAIAEKVLSQGFSMPLITMLAKILLKRHKEYYLQLHLASKTLDLTSWILWFSSVVIEAQRNTLAHVDFIINKTKLLDCVREQLNVRQEKVLLRMLREGPDGFSGGMNAEKYRHITGASTASTTRDLHDLVEKNVLTRAGERKSTRYFLAMDLNPVKTVLVDDIL